VQPLLARQGRDRQFHHQSFITAGLLAHAASTLRVRIARALLRRNFFGAVAPRVAREVDADFFETIVDDALLERVPGR
jgi:hypothetical protein